MKRFFDKENDIFHLQRHLFYFLRNVLWHRDNSFPIRVFSRIDNVLLVNEVDHVFLLFQVLRPIYLCSRILVSFGPQGSGYDSYLVEFIE